MPPISLDEIIHYRPPTTKTQFQWPQSISLYHQNYSNPSSDGPILSHAFPPNQAWPSGFPLSAHEQCPQKIPHSPVESVPSLPLTESTGEAAIGLSDKMGMDFPNVTLEEDTGGPISNAHWSTSDLLNVFDGASLTGPGDHCDNRSQAYRWYQGTHMSPFQHHGEPDSVKEPTVSTLASPGDDPSPAAKANKSENKTLPSIFADSVKVRDRILQDSSTTVSATTKEHLSITTNEHSLTSTDRNNPDPPFGRLSDDVAPSTGDAEAGSDELRESPVFTNGEEIPPDKYGGHSAAEFCESIEAEANEAVFTDAENELSHKEVETPSISCESNRISPSGRRSISMSPISQCGRGQSKCNRTGTDANLPSASELQSVVITNSGFRERELGNIKPSVPAVRPKGKRGPSGSSHSGSCGDGSSDADDMDYASESSMLSRQSKRDRRAVVQGSPTYLRHNKKSRRKTPSRRGVSWASKYESYSQAPRNRSSIFSLSDRETIPIRGFLTREVLLSKVVYSITFEERNEDTRLQDPGGTSRDCEREAQRRKPPQQKKVSPAQILSKDDELLIELKEERGLTWKQIGEYFPKRSVGSLQVRFSTRLKNRHGRRPECTKDPKNQTTYSRLCQEEPCQSRELSATNVKSKAAEGSLRQRYGPPRRRQTVDRYTPI